jgi:hypothetical protein
MDYIIIISKKK